MTQSIEIPAAASDSPGRARRLVAAIVAAVVILSVLSIVELGALAFVAAFSSVLNQRGAQ